MANGKSVMINIISHGFNLNHEIWILGNFKVDYLSRDRLDVKKFIATFKSYGLSQLIKDITRPFNAGGTCIDWIITNSSFISKSGVGDHLISDHLPVFCTRKKKQEHHNTVVIEARDHSNYSVENLKNLFATTDWTIYDNSTDPNDMYAIILDRLYEIQVLCVRYVNSNSVKHLYAG